MCDNVLKIHDLQQNQYRYSSKKMKKPLHYVKAESWYIYQNKFGDKLPQSHSYALISLQIGQFMVWKIHIEQGWATFLNEWARYKDRKIDWAAPNQRPAVDFKPLIPRTFKQ